MDDESLIAAFEACSLPAADFTHAEHVRAAWWYLTQHAFAEARDRFGVALRRFAAAHGVPDRYHETITVAYLLLIAERLDAARGLTWTRFAGLHPELLARSPSILARHYSDETLRSERAKHSFVMPDRLPLPRRIPLARTGERTVETLAPDSQRPCAAE
jgi:hypothetical protein